MLLKEFSMIVLSSWVCGVFYCSGFGCTLRLSGHPSYCQLYDLGQSHRKESMATKRDWTEQLNIGREWGEGGPGDFSYLGVLGTSDEFRRGKHVFEKDMPRLLIRS